MANRVVNGLGSPLLALLLADILPLPVSSAGVFWGAIIGAGWSMWLTAVVAPLAMHHYATMNLIVTLGCIALCTALDWRVTSPRRRQGPSRAVL